MIIAAAWCDVFILRKILTDFIYCIAANVKSEFFRLPGMLISSGSGFIGNKTKKKKEKKREAATAFDHYACGCLVSTTGKEKSIRSRDSVSLSGVLVYAYGLLYVHQVRIQKGAVLSDLSSL